MKIRVVTMGRHYHETEDLPEFLELQEQASLDQAIERLRQLLPPGVDFPGSCLIALSGKHVGSIDSHSAVPLSDGDELMLLAPVAGG
ncbi:MAG: hypothetical protein CMJ75_12810 [Planctomycetaceae bacterium]|nr:hypothetical protein [Planctomycetaceae bacterium]